MYDIFLITIMRLKKKKYTIRSPKKKEGHVSKPFLNLFKHNTVDSEQRFCKTSVCTMVTELISNALCYFAESTYNLGVVLRQHVSPQIKCVHSVTEC